MKKILVTGATGFLGSAVVALLLEKNYHVIASSRDREKAKKKSWFSKVQFIACDINNLRERDYFTFFDRPDLLIHLAWTGLPNYNDAFHVNINLKNQKLFLKNLITNGLKDLTVAGTCLEYGLQEGCLSEEFKTMPTTFYGKAKDSLQQWLSPVCDQHRVSLKWLRLFYIYGEGQGVNSLYTQLRIAAKLGSKNFNMSAGEQVRDFLSLQDMAEQIVKASLQQKISGCINCCSGIPQKVVDFVKEQLTELHVSMQLNLGYYPYNTYEPMNFWGCVKKQKTII